jgi:hypothetical protein
MFTAHARRTRQVTASFHACQNCGASTLDQQDGPSEWLGVCDVCEVLNKHGWVFS